MKRGNRKANATTGTSPNGFRPLCAIQRISQRNDPCGRSGSIGIRNHNARLRPRGKRARAGDIGKRGKIGDYMPLTHANFSMQASYLASRASSWAGECLMLPEQLEKPMRDHSVERFTAMLRETADMIDRMQNEEAP